MVASQEAEPDSHLGLVCDSEGGVEGRLVDHVGLGEREEWQGEGGGRTHRLQYVATATVLCEECAIDEATLVLRLLVEGRHLETPQPEGDGEEVS